MSYTISITWNDVPKDDNLAWKYMEDLYNNDSGQASEGFTELIKKLTEKYLCICDLPDDKIDDGVWSDGPLVNNAGDKITTLGFVFLQVENVIPFIVETSNNLGFVVFDGQSGIIYRPCQNGEQRSDNIEKKGFLSRLLGK